MEAVKIGNKLKFLWHIHVRCIYATTTNLAVAEYQFNHDLKCMNVITKNISM